MLIIIDLLDIEQEQICEIHQLIELGEEWLLPCKWIAGCIYCCMNTFSLCKLEKLDEEIHLKQRLTTAHCYTTTVFPIWLIAERLL